MEPKIFITIAFAVLWVAGISGSVYSFNKEKTKAANVFGWIWFVSSIALIVMGAIIHRWWVWVPAIIAVIISGLFLLVNNSEDGPYPPDSDDE